MRLLPVIPLRRCLLVISPLRRRLLVIPHALLWIPRLLLVVLLLVLLGLLWVVYSRRRLRDGAGGPAVVVAAVAG